LFFTQTFTGISKILSINLYNLLIASYSTPTILNIFDFTNKFILDLNEKISYRIYKNNEIYKDFYCLPLETYDNGLSYIEFSNTHELLDEFFAIKDKQERINSRAIDLQRLIHTNIDRCTKKAMKLNNILKECEKKDIFRIEADLLTSYIY
ncbi:NFACT family protein, partial [Acinetobacter baumannii]|nr:NFACT family protein [Acinetobacter baumannii]